MRFCLLLACLFASIVSARDLTLVTNEWPPYSMQNGKQPGYAVELVQALAASTGLKINIKVLPLWDDAMSMVKKGDADGIFPIYKTAARLQTLAYTQPLLMDNLVLYKRKDTDFGFPTATPSEDWVETFNNMQQHPFGVVKNYANIPEFDDNPHMKRLVVDNDRDNLQQLINKKVDFIFINKLVAMYLLSDQFKDSRNKVSSMMPEVSTNPLFIAISRSNPEHDNIIEALNKGIHQMQEAHTPQTIMVKYLSNFIDPDVAPVKH